MKKVLYTALALFFSSSACFAGDSFLTSCQSTLESNAAALKSMRAELCQTFEIAGHSQKQTANMMYLSSDVFYSKMEATMPLGKFTMLCRGDTTYTKIGDSNWNAGKNQCGDESPLKKSVKELKARNLSFVKDSSNLRLYKDTVGVQYLFEPATCRLLEIRAFENGAQTATTRYEYEKINGVDFPVKETTTMSLNKLKKTVEYKSVIVNKGVTKSFFEVK